MDITQIYETTIVDRESGAEARFIVLPRRAFTDTNLLPSDEQKDEGEVMRFEELVLELAGVEPSLITTFLLPRAVAECIAKSSPEFFDERERISPSDIQRFEIEQYLRHMEFAEILSMAPVVPFEQSPLSLDSVASLITKTSGVGLGAYAGFVVGGASPLIFVTVPAGMIIFGAAAGVANALEKGLRDRLLKLIKGQRIRRKPSTRA